MITANELRGKLAKIQHNIADGCAGKDVVEYNRLLNVYKETDNERIKCRGRMTKDVYLRILYKYKEYLGVLACLGIMSKRKLDRMLDNEIKEIRNR
jgi:hypothetical protein